MPSAPAQPFVDLVRHPDTATVFVDDEPRDLVPDSSGHWQWGDVTVSTAVTDGSLAVALSADRTAVQKVRLRWSGSVPAGVQVLGDHWERSYGDLEWRGLRGERPLPWYAATTDGSFTHAYGVAVQPGAFCFWLVDPRGITLWLDTRSGGQGVVLGGRTLEACRVVCRQGEPGETPFQAVVAFCRRMCPAPRLPAQPVYGHNDWYSMYGSADQPYTLRIAELTAALAPDAANRPFVVVDGGWQPEGGCEGDCWDRGNGRFPDIARLAGRLESVGVRPGIWMRPLSTSPETPARLRRADRPSVYDPTHPETLAKVAADVARIRSWGYRLIKHDFSTYDILGRWGFSMGAEITDGGWTFGEGPARTTAEVIVDLYRTIRDAAGDALLIGCNTVGHLSAGLFELSRIGDDTSGRVWERTRRMGVNSLAFRSAQHRTFHDVDADCAGITPAIPWELNRQWLDVLARSGTALFVSLPREPIGPDVTAALREAFATAAVPRAVGEPIDWLATPCPERWRFADGEQRYGWTEPGGADPFTV